VAEKAAPRQADAKAAGNGAALIGWQQRALDRSLVAAWRRALDKSNGFVQAVI